jgi:hypothetical protein
MGGGIGWRYEWALFVRRLRHGLDLIVVSTNGQSTAHKRLNCNFERFSVSRFSRIFVLDAGIVVTVFPRPGRTPAAVNYLATPAGACLSGGRWRRHRSPSRRWLSLDLFDLSGWVSYSSASSHQSLSLTLVVANVTFHQLALDEET